jgi:DNA invertase Pin-like site-specific DNA recombinase
VYIKNTIKQKQRKDKKTMAIVLSQANQFLNEEIYNEEIENQVEELLNGIVVDQATINEKIDLVKNKYHIEKPTMCVFYGRVSSEKTQQRSSIITQYGIGQDFENEYLSQGFIIKEYVFERQSATTAKKRKKFMNTVERSKQGEFNAIVVKVVDRMFRNTKDTINIMDDLQEKNVALVFFYDELNSLIEDDRTEIIQKATSAEEYSKRLSKNVKRGKQRNIKNGKGRVPAYVFGYDKIKVGDSSLANINTEEAELVNELFMRFAINNEAMSAIVRDWRSRGIKSKLNNEVGTVMLYRMLRNPIYKGIVINNKSDRKNVRVDRTPTDKDEWVYIERPDLRIISDEMFDLAQQRLDKQSFGEGHNKNVPQQRLFKSLIRCNCCGKNYKKIKNGVNPHTGQINDYYVCQTYKQPARHAEPIKCDNNNTIRKDELIYSLGVYFKQMLNNEDNIRELVYNSVTNILNRTNNQEELVTIQNNIKTTDEKYKRELRLFREGVIDDTTNIKKLKLELDSLKADLAMKQKVNNTNFEVNELVDNIFSTIEELVDKGWNIDNEDVIPAERINGLFDSVIACDDGTFVFNLTTNTNRYVSHSLKGQKQRDSLISTSCNTNRDRCNEKYLFTNKQLQVLEKQRSDLVFISLNEFFDYDEINEEMNNIRTYNNVNLYKLRYSNRHHDLGKTFIDSINIVL